MWFLSDFIFWDFIFWLNFDILLFWDGHTIAQKSSFLHTFSWHLSLFSVLKEWGHFIQLKSSSFFRCFLLVMQAVFFFFISSLVFFFFIWFHWKNDLFITTGINFWNIGWTYFHVFNIKTFRAILGLVFSNVYQSSIFDGYYCQSQLY